MDRMRRMWLWTFKTVWLEALMVDFLRQIRSSQFLWLISDENTVFALQK